jgi:hypothetical protein
MKTLIVFFIAKAGFCAVIPASQQPAELAYQLAKYYQLAGTKQITCERKKSEVLAENEAKDFGNFSLKAQADILSFTGNPGIKSGHVELSVNDLITVSFTGEKPDQKYVALIPNTKPLLEQGTAEAVLMAPASAGKLASSKTTQLQCSLR